MSVVKHACANADCRVVETGRCVDGLELSKCPHYGKPAVETVGDKQGKDEGATGAIQLRTGELLSPSDVSVLMAEHESRLIAIVGTHAAGKTSLIASLFELFQRGSVNGCAFRGSLTLPGFEQACHHARAESLRKVPFTARTPFSEVRFFHLQLLPTGQAPVHVLCSDRAGEAYQSVGDDPGNAAELVEVRSANVLVFLVDGGRLADAVGRHNVKGDLIVMLQGLRDSGLLGDNRRAALVLTKVDAVNASGRSQAAFTDFDGIVAEVRRIVGASCSEIETFKVAASPHSSEYDQGHGVNALLAYCMREPPMPKLAPVPATSDRLFMTIPGSVAS